MAQGTLWIQPINTVFKGGVFVPGAKAYFYLAGTTTPVNVYSDVGLTTAITQPVVADSSNGSFQEVFLTPGTAYKVDVQTSAGVSLQGYPADNQLAIPASSANVQQTETAGEALTAGLVAYLSDGSGGKNNGQLYKADSANPYSSTLPVIGIVPSAISASATGSFITAGQVTGLSSLTVGADYYVGTSGALTATAPSNARLVGRADSTSTLIVTGNPRAFVNPTICQGRLTGTSGTAVTTSDVSNITTLYFTPYIGNLISLYDGTNWATMSFSETSLALGTLTSGLPYDVFGYNNAGTFGLELLAWTSTTARATAITLQNGVYVKSGATTRRYLGTFYTTSTTQTQDTARQRLVYNYYNRLPRPMLRQESTASWNYSTNTWRQANAGATNQLEIMQGVAESAVDVFVGVGINSTAGGDSVQIGIAEDSTTTPLNTVIGGAYITLSSTGYAMVTCSMTRIPAVGYHYYPWMEIGAGANTQSWRAANGYSPATAFGGLRGMWWS